MRLGDELISKMKKLLFAVILLLVFGSIGFSQEEKEVEEETGLRINMAKNNIFDLDIHVIPERKGIPSHEHFDVRFKFVVDKDQTIARNHESLDIQWVPLSEIKDYTEETSILRMVEKTTLY